jgi:ABC-2 type transport system permease protein
VFTLALLGGNFIYLAQLPDLLQRLSLLTPNGWALRGFVDLVADGGGLSTVAAPVAVTAAFGLVTGAVALVRARRMVVA